MRFEISNVGPLRRAAVELRPLTVLIGPNNTGKSFLATIIYSSLSSSSHVARSPYVARAISYNAQAAASATAPFPDSDSVEVQGWLAEVLDTGKPPAYGDLPRPLRTVLATGLPQVLQALGQAVAAEFARAAGAELPELRLQKPRTNASVRITGQQVAWSLRLTVSGSGPEITVEPPDPSAAWQAVDHEFWRRLRLGLREGVLIGSTFITTILAELTRSCLGEYPLRAKYLPAARSGLMQSHKALAGSIVRRSSWAGIEDMQVPALTGVLTDFLSEMIEMDASSRGSFAGIADALEADLLAGSVRLTGDARAYPEVVYHSEQGDFPLGRTSSMISELAPVVLYLRHVLQRNDLLIIEEPEAHLHPAGQAKLAMHLVRLVNAGLRLVLTTHSEFFLQQLNNAIVASGVGPARSESAGLSPADTIEPDKVAAYLFKPTARGTEVESLTVDPAEGIPETSFGEVAEYLYDQSVQLEPSSLINA